MSAALRIATRGSLLALWQARWVKAELERREPGLTVELVYQGGTFPSPLGQQSWPSLPPPRATRGEEQRR